MTWVNRFLHRVHFLFRFLNDSHLVLISTNVRVNTITKQHIKNIIFVQINCMLWVKCLCILEVFPLIVVISAGVVYQRKETLKRSPK